MIPQSSGKKLKQLTGGKAPLPPDIIDSDNNKHTTPEAKEYVFRDTWKETFRISEEENSSFEAVNDALVSDFINNNLARTKPYGAADLNRLITKMN